MSEFLYCFKTVVIIRII